jgi:hypothetical protein
MPRPYPNRGRRWPGRRPPNRFMTGRRPRRSGFTPPGMRTFYKVAMPGLKGRAKREYFNQVSSWLVTGSALGGAACGYTLLGVVGAVVGLGAGLVAGGSMAEKGGFYRP